MLPPLPRCSGWAYPSLFSPSGVSLPRKGRRVGLHIVLFEACSAFTRVAACTLARPPIRDRYPGASDISSPPCLPRLLPAGAVAGWALHPLESAAFPRRTPKAVTRRTDRDGLVWLEVAKTATAALWCAAGQSGHCVGSTFRPRMERTATRVARPADRHFVAPVRNRHSRMEPARSRHETLATAAASPLRQHALRRFDQAESEP